MINKLKYFFNHILLRKPVMIEPQLTAESYEGGFEPYVYYTQERIEIRRGKWGVTEWVYSDKLQRAKLNGRYVVVPPYARSCFHFPADKIQAGDRIDVKINVTTDTDVRKV
jgi:hypothetical protein